MVQVVLPNDANPLGFILGGTVMHLIDIAAAIACHRHTRSLLVTAAVDGLQFLHPIKVGDLIILRSKVTATWSTSLEAEVEVFSEEILTGARKLTSRAYLTFVTIDTEGRRVPVPPLILDTDAERQKAAEADLRRAERLKAKRLLDSKWQQLSERSRCSYLAPQRFDRDRSSPGTGSGTCVRRCPRAGIQATRSAPRG
jgi:acyl-CoA hydrolase